MLLTAENKDSSTAELVRSREGQDLKRIVAEFKDLCLKQGITPILIYIPTAVSIYAEHSTPESGENWLALRDLEIARKRVTEDAVAGLAREVDIRMLDLDIPFESAARDGELLYYTFDTHWNSRGREVAAAYVAENLNVIRRNVAGSTAAAK